MLITNVWEQDQCEIPAALYLVLAVVLCVSASNVDGITGGI